MEFQIVLVLGLAVVVGLALGLLGGGGSILMVPLLTYVAGMEPKEAIAASLFVVGVTSLVSVFTHARGETSAGAPGWSSGRRAWRVRSSAVWRADTFPAPC